jgi:hypothetical protein
MASGQRERGGTAPPMSRVDFEPATKFYAGNRAVGSSKPVGRS